MKKILLLHAILEMLAGTILVFQPSLFLMVENQNISTIFVVKLYAIVAFSFGAVSFMLYRLFEYNDNFKKIIMIIMAFHLMISLQLFSAYKQGLVETIGAFLIHLILAILLAVVYMREINLFNPKPNHPND